MDFATSVYDSKHLFNEGILSNVLRAAEKTLSQDKEYKALNDELYEKRKLLNELENVVAYSPSGVSVEQYYEECKVALPKSDNLVEEFKRDAQIVESIEDIKIFSKAYNERIFFRNKYQEFVKNYEKYQEIVKKEPKIIERLNQITKKATLDAIKNNKDDPELRDFVDLINKGYRPKMPEKTDELISPKQFVLALLSKYGESLDKSSQKDK